MHGVLLFLFVILFLFAIFGASLAVWRPSGLPTRATSTSKPKKQLSFKHWTTSLAPTFFTPFLITIELRFLPACLPVLLAAGLQCCCWPHPPDCQMLHAVSLILALRPNLHLTWLYNPGLYVQVFHSGSTFLGTSQGSSVEVQVANCHLLSHCHTVLAASIIGLAALPLDCCCIATKIATCICLYFANNFVHVLHIKLIQFFLHKALFLTGYCRHREALGN